MAGVGTPELCAANAGSIYGALFKRRFSNPDPSPKRFPYPKWQILNFKLCTTNAGSIYAALFMRIYLLVLFFIGVQIACVGWYSP